MSVALQGSLWRLGLPPGVYEERPRVARRMDVRLDVAAFVGLAERGPLNTPVGIDDPARFEQLFGRPLPGLNLPQAVRLFFANGGRRCVVVRCMDHARARTTRLTLPGIVARRGGSLRRARIAARNPGAWGNDLALTLVCARQAMPLGMELTRDGGSVVPRYLAPGGRLGVGSTLLLVGRPWRRGHPPRQRLCRVVEVRPAPDGTSEVVLSPPPIRGFRSAALLAAAQVLTLRLEVRLHDRLIETWADAALHPDHPRYLPRLIGRRSAGEQLRPARWDQPDPEDPAAEQDRIWGDLGDPFGSELIRPSALLADAWLRPNDALLGSPGGLTLTGAELPDAMLGGDATETTDRDHFFEPTVMYADDVAEDSDHRFIPFGFRPGSLEPNGPLAAWDAKHPFEPVALVSVPDLLHPSPPPEAGPAPSPEPGAPCFAIACIPPADTATLPALDYPRLGYDATDLRAAQHRVVDACEVQGTRIAMLDLPPGLLAAEVVTWREALSSDRTALYAPWLRGDVDDVATDLPPSPVACGITAGVERQTGVWAAPANRKVVGVFARGLDAGLPVPGFLHAERIDEVRHTERGLLLLGARTTSHDPDWTHISVRRLVDWLKLQIAADLAWAPFEPNDQALWSAMVGIARRRLLALFDAGALAGRTDADAYFVRCDATTNTQVDLDAGRALMLIGVAPAVPAEFITFRLVRHGADAPRLEVA